VPADDVKFGIAIDAWKLPIFTRHINQSGYAFTNNGHLTAGCLILGVETDNMEALAGVIKAANTEAAMTGAPK
jgi:hypothetical protein